MNVMKKQVLKKADSLVNSLIVKSMEYNYVEFVKEFGFEKADEGMARIFGQSWEKHKEQIWQWYDMEVSDERPNS